MLMQLLKLKTLFVYCGRLKLGGKVGVRDLYN